MKDSITITRKGQTTLPVEIRRKFGLAKLGGVLRIHFNEQKNQLTISKPESVAELSARISSQIKKDIAPLENIDDYYQKNRSTRT